MAEIFEIITDVKVYFSASRFYREENRQNCTKIIEILRQNGLRVMDNSQIASSTGTFEMPDEEKAMIYKNMLKMMDRSDICIFEASHPSTLHIGHEMSVALEKGKVVVVLYTKQHEPILFRGIEEVKIIWVEYNSANLEKKLVEAIDKAKKTTDVRFNFFVSPKILSYLDWVAKKRMIPRSVFLRELIEREMKKDKEFKG